MKRFWLLLTDARLRAAAGALEEAGLLAGDLAARPGDAATLMKPVRERLAAALKAGRPASLAAASAAEDMTARLEKLFSDMALLQAPPDRPAAEALLRLQLACAQAPRLLSIPRRKKSYLALRALSAEGRKILAAARAAADGAGFPQNLKFSSIYTGLDAVFDALERCAEALFEA